MSFPRLNNVGFWLLPPSLILLITGLFSGGAGVGASFIYHKIWKINIISIRSLNGTETRLIQNKKF